MSGARHPETSCELDDLVACCEWVADAHAAADSRQAAVALGELYRLLVARGWRAPPRAEVVLRLQDALAVELRHLLVRPRDDA